MVTAIEVRSVVVVTIVVAVVAIVVTVEAMVVAIVEIVVEVRISICLWSCLSNSSPFTKVQVQTPYKMAEGLLAFQFRSFLW